MQPSDLPAGCSVVCQAIGGWTKVSLFGRWRGRSWSYFPTMRVVMVVESKSVKLSRFGNGRGVGCVGVSVLCTTVFFGAGEAVADPLPAECAQAGNIVTCEYSTSGGPYSVALPNDVTTVSVDAVGGRGGQSDGGGPGGAGGAVSTTLPVSGGSRLFVYVGGNGGDGGVAGVNGGGRGFGGGGGGGGASDVRVGADDLASRQVVAAGGGGGATGGGSGGGPGQAGAGRNPGGGASTASGGAAGGGSSTAGMLGQGGNASIGTSGGGGGGGLYGGGGGSGGSVGGGGGGGSNFDGSNTASTDAARVRITYTVSDCSGSWCFDSLIFGS